MNYLAQLGSNGNMVGRSRSVLPREVRGLLTLGNAGLGLVRQR